jgi:glycopeptide antibiotics resistance protein
MSAYIFPIRTALIFFPILSFIFSVPIFIFQYRKYGHFVFFRGIVIYSFIFYLLCAYFLVILPLPSPTEVATYTSQQLEWRPFIPTIQNFLSETVLEISHPRTYLQTLMQGVVLEPLFNILLFVPFGVYLRYYFQLNLKQTILVSFCLSLFFELTQLSGLYFIYPRAYRLADVNDLIHNTFGGFMGYGLSPLISHFFPSRVKMDEKALRLGKHVTYTRRIIAFILDIILLNILQSFLVNISDIFGNESLLLVLYLVFFQFLTGGWSVGKKIVKIKVTMENGERPTLFILIKRYLLLYIVPFLAGNYFSLFGEIFSAEEISDTSIQLIPVYLGVYGLMAAFVLIWFLAFVYAMGFKRRQLYYESLTHTIVTSE